MLDIPYKTRKRIGTGAIAGKLVRAVVKWHSTMGLEASSSVIKRDGAFFYGVL